MNQKKCACKGSFLDKFIQPSILFELLDNDKTGSGILKNLNKGTMAKYGKLDPTGFYRTLKKMDEAGTITSEWLTAGQEKPIKVYSITNSGRICLKTWEITLKQYIEDMGDLYNQIAKKTK